MLTLVKSDERPAPSFTSWQIAAMVAELEERMPGFSDGVLSRLRNEALAEQAHTSYPAGEMRAASQQAQRTAISVFEMFRQWAWMARGYRALYGKKKHKA